jgi:DNA uptake protein ComE-like DNA-binding protein
MELTSLQWRSTNHKLALAKSMKKTFYIFCLIIFLLPFGLMAGEKIDINNASEETLRQLPVPEETLLLLEEYLLYHGEFTSIYQIRDIKGISYEDFLLLKDRLAIFPQITVDQTENKIEDRYYRLESMMNDEGASEGLVESWIDLFTNPRNVNTMHYFDLVNLPAVSPVDAAAVIKFLQDGNEIKSARDMRGLEGISYYGYRNISDYVRYTDDSTATWNGYLTATVKDFAAQISPDDGGSLMDQIVFDKYPLDQYYKFHLNYGQKLSFGLAYTQSLSEGTPTFGNTNIPQVKAYASVQDVSLGKLGKFNKIIAGNYIASFGQGVVMETVDYFAPRKSGYGWRKRLIGISGDASRARTYSQNGLTAEYQLGSLFVTPFIGYNTRDAIVNPDSSFSAFIRMEPRLENGLGGQVSLGLLNNVHELLYGSNIRFKPIPNGHIGMTFYESLYDRELDFQPEVIIANMEKYMRQIGNSADAEIAATYESYARSALWNKAKAYRRVMGMDFSYSLKNVVFQGEIGVIDRDGKVFNFKDDPVAYTVNMYWQFENFNFLALYRNYDLGYDNPYQRSFSNYARYKTTIYEDIYYLLDDAYGFLYSGSSQPQSEKGLYYSLRYQLSRSLIATVEHDIWERVADRAKYNRLVARMEYRPVFNYRIRLRQKWQSRYNENFFTSNVYRSNETILSNEFRLSRFNRLYFDLIYGYTEFSPRARLVYTTSGGASMVGNAGSPSRGIRAGFTHNFNDRLKIIASGMIYNGFIWNFEDTDFRVTNSPVDAFRGWITLYSRITDNLSLRFKYTLDTRLDQTNIVEAYIELDDGSLLQLSNLNYRLGTNDFRLQLDYRF